MIVHVHERMSEQHRNTAGGGSKGDRRVARTQTVPGQGDERPKDTEAFGVVEETKGMGGWVKTEIGLWFRLWVMLSPKVKFSAELQ